MCNTENNLSYDRCFVAFMDILGFKNKVIESHESEEILKMLFDSLNICGVFPSGGKKIVDSDGNRRNIDVQSRFFSDSIVVFMKEDPKDIAQLFFMIRYLQDILWKKKICLRGAISIGDMYWPEGGRGITIGPALIEAYELESRLAIFPRILVSRQLNSYIANQNIDSYPFGQGPLLRDLISKDNDGMYYLDLLNPEVTRAMNERLEQNNGLFSIRWYRDDETNWYNVVTNVREIIEENTSVGNVAIGKKYFWLQSYLDAVVTT